MVAAGPGSVNLLRIYKSLKAIFTQCLTDILLTNICVPCCHNQPKVGNDFLELVSSSDAEEKELSSKSKIVCL